MKIFKKFIVKIIFVLIIVMLVIPSFSYGAECTLDEKKRAEIVDLATKIILECNTGKNSMLIYSQVSEARNSGFYWQKIKTDIHQGSSSRGTLAITKAHALALYEALGEGQLKKVPEILTYDVILVGPSVKGKIGFDCSSFCSAVYNMILGYPEKAESCATLEASGLFTVSTDLSSVEPGDILYYKKEKKEESNHVAIYLGDYANNGTKYIAHARGTSLGTKTTNKAALSDKLFKYLLAHPTYIKEHVNYNPKNIPEIELDFGMEVRIPQKQVSITTMKGHKFNRVLKYKGEIGQGRVINTGNISSTPAQTTPGDSTTPNTQTDPNSATQTTTPSGIHRPIVLPNNYIVKWPEGILLEDETLPTSKGYFYKGTPSYGVYIGKVDLFNWFIEGAENVLDWLIGFITYAFKAAFIGWTAILENIMSNILNFGLEPMQSGSTGCINLETNLLKVTEIPLGLAINKIEEKQNLVSTIVLADIQTSTTQPATTQPAATQPAATTTPPATEPAKSQTSGNTTPKTTLTQESDIDASETKKKMNIEDILFNRVPVLDIDFFNLEQAGGQKLNKDSLLYKIRITISQWYYVIRMVILMGMLVTLLYVAIKMSLSVPSKKAEYKSKLIDWLVGFIIVFFIHYFMVAILALNNQIVKILDPYASVSTTVNAPKVESNSNSNFKTTNEGKVSLYEAIRIQAHDIKATTGIAAAVIYAVLVFFMIRFVILYAKRMFVLAVLTILAPIMGLLYSINKKKYRLGDWSKEYVYNVIIQFVHVVIYTAVVGLAFDLSKSETFKGGVIALIALNLMFTAENMVKKIFGFNKASTSTGLMNTAVTQLASYKAAETIFKKTSEKSSQAVTAMKDPNNRFIRAWDKYISKKTSVSDWDSRYKLADGQNETEDERRERRAKNVLGSKGFKPNTIKLNNGRQYIVDKNGVPISAYDYVLDADKGKYFTMSSVDKRMEEAKREESQARKAYIYQRLSDATKATAGTLALMVAVPMLVVSPSTGLGFSAYGIHALVGSTGRRKVKGVKKTEKSRKWTGKRLVFAFATAGLSEAAINMIKNEQDEREVLETTHTKKIKLIEKARKKEDELAKLIINDELAKKSDIGSEDTEEVRSAKEKMNSVAREIDRKEFERSVDATFKNVKKNDIEKVVLNYITNNKKNSFNKKDIDNLTTELGNHIKGKYKEISLNQDFSNIVRDEIRDRIMHAGNYVIANKNKSEENKNNIVVGSALREKENIRSNEYGKSNKETEANSENPETLRQRIHLREEHERRRPTEITEQELDKKVDDLIDNMKHEELIDIIDSALKRKDAINRNGVSSRYEEIMGTAKELEKLNKEYEELFDEPLYIKYEVIEGKVQKVYDNDGQPKYENVSELVKNMRNYLVDYINIKA